MTENFTNIITLFLCCTILVLQLQGTQKKYAAGIAGVLYALFLKGSRYKGGTVFRIICSDPTPGSVDHDQQNTWNKSSSSVYPQYQTGAMQCLPIYLPTFSVQSQIAARKNGSCLAISILKKAGKLSIKAGSVVKRCLRQMAQKLMIPLVPALEV